ncbi:MAG TPA: hypothetical protein VF666_12565 [Pyrinomonadaceae bacterium]
MVEHFSSDRDMEYLVLDSAIVLTHACAANAQKRGRIKFRPKSGSFSTKIHLATDALGMDVCFISTGGQRNDITQADLLVERAKLHSDHSLRVSIAKSGVRLTCISIKNGI